MKFIINKEQLLYSLQKINILIGKRTDIPILNNILIQIKKNFLLLITNNLEIQITAKLNLNLPFTLGEITIPGKKFLDICRSFPEKSNIEISLKKNKITVISNKIFFSLITLPAQNFPIFPDMPEKKPIEFFIQEKKLKNIIKSTYFCMAYSDIRYYLNGMNIQIQKNFIRCITTDGYRIAISNFFTDENNFKISIIIPRNSILELYKILKNTNNLIKILIDKKNILIKTQNFNFITKLIDGSFPKCDNLFLDDIKTKIEVNTELFYRSISRISILSNELFRGISLEFFDKKIKISTQNQEDEIAEEIINIKHQNNFQKFKISINVNYILDVLNVIEGENIKLIINNSLSNIQIEDCENFSSKYLIMSLRL